MEENRRRSKDDDKDSSMDPTDRTEAEEVYDGSDADTSDSMSSDEKECRNSSATGQTFNVANRPETYKSMGVNGRKIEECDLRESPQMGSGHGDDRKQEYFEKLA